MSSVAEEHHPTARVKEFWEKRQTLIPLVIQAYPSGHENISVIRELPDLVTTVDPKQCHYAFPNDLKSFSKTFPLLQSLSKEQLSAFADKDAGKIVAPKLHARLSGGPRYPISVDDILK